MKLLKFNHFYLVGIKGVAMTSIAQCLVDADKSVTGCDVKQDFVTKKLLSKINCNNENIDIGFENNLPSDAECIIFTSAHGGIDNPLVQQAIERNIPTYSQAEALSYFFNDKLGVAVCGVGGKSSVSAMITWILEKIDSTSFSVGVGNIPGLEKTGQWNKDSKYFVAEADEYVTDPSAPQKNIPITPRFSYLKPYVTVCTNLEYDHPDVYRDFDHTKEVYTSFFSQIKTNGKLVINANNNDLLALAKKTAVANSSLEIITFKDNSDTNNTSENEEKSIFTLKKYSSSRGKTVGEFVHFDDKTETTFSLTLNIPGKFNIMNGISAIAACHSLGFDITQSINALQSFRSTMRRFEYVGSKNNVSYYDDYAHHPNEVSAAITAFNEWYPDEHKIIAFQSHTYSRTKSLFKEFVDSFKNASEVVMIDIFPSAREVADMSVSSTLLCAEITKKYPHIKATNVVSLENLATYLKDNLKQGDACLTVGAGDIYEVHDLI